MAKKLYVGSLSYSTTDDSLKAHFEQAGPVESATVVMDKMTGRSRGFGFVEMASDADADKAVEMLNGKKLEGFEHPDNRAGGASDGVGHNVRGAQNSIGVYDERGALGHSDFLVINSELTRKFPVVVG